MLPLFAWFLLKLQFSSLDNDAPLNVPFSFPCRSSFYDIIDTAPKAKLVKFNAGLFLDSWIILMMMYL